MQQSRSGIFRKYRVTGRPQRRGAIFVTALGVVVVLSGMVLVFAQEMRTEALASKNRVSALQASVIEQGAEQWVVAQIETALPGDAVGITQVPAEQLQIGDGYFWVLRPDPTTDQNYAFGITDEAGKININVATSLQLQLLPGMTPEAADSIVDWRDADSNANPNGAESDYYESLGSSEVNYDAKNGNFETVEELVLVKGIKKNPEKGVPVDLLFGYDLNRDGVIDVGESNAGGMATSFNSAGTDSRGFFNYVSVYNTEPNTDASGKARINVNDANARANLAKFLNSKLTKSVANGIIAKMGPRARYANVLDFLIQTGVPKTSYALIIDGLTTTRKKTRAGLININTAPKQVLMCLTGLTESDADNLVSKRSGADLSNIAWVIDALGDNKKATNIGGAITGRSFQYSADIVAVSGDGRSYKRSRIVVDASKLPSKIVYRKDLSSLGWPLDPAIRDALRSGAGLAPTLGGTAVGLH